MGRKHSQAQKLQYIMLVHFINIIKELGKTVVRIHRILQ
uniref:Uncharacterized protein n=1 Tax=Anguilla anguilla TaxID=7936 RepID=A0A0E9URR6_ANGAN